MEVTINYNGQAVAVEVTLEVYEFLDRADHKTENLFHEQRRHWDGREFDEYIITTEGVGVYPHIFVLFLFITERGFSCLKHGTARRKKPLKEGHIRLTIVLKFWASEELPHISL